MANETPRHPVTNMSEGARELIGQTSYSDVIKQPTLDSGFSTPFHGIEVLTDGNVELETANGQRVIPLETGRIYPIEIHQVLSGNTTIGATDILLYEK